MAWKRNVESGVAVQENVVAGIVGAFLFALSGGIVWYLLYQIGFIAGISGIIGVICAIKGYALFAKKESVKGVVIAVVMTVLVLAIAWYICLAQDVYTVHQEWFAAGEIDYTLTFFESVRYAYLWLAEPEILLPYLGDFGLGLLFCVGGAFTSIRNAIRAAKAAPAEASASVEAPAPVEETVLNGEEVAVSESSDGTVQE